MAIVRMDNVKLTGGRGLDRIRGIHLIGIENQADGEERVSLEKRHAFVGWAP